MDATRDSFSEERIERDNEEEDTQQLAAARISTAESEAEEVDGSVSLLRH